MILSSQIGSKTGIADWPTNDLDGLIDALQRWPLDRRLDLSTDPLYSADPYRAPFRGRAWGHCEWKYDQASRKRFAVATRPIYPEHPEAIRFFGNFIGHSFPFWLDTADEALIQRLDEAIAKNIANQSL